MANDKDKSNENPSTSVNRMPLSDKMKSLFGSLKMHTSKPYREEKDDVETSQVMDGGNVVATVVKAGGKVVSASTSPDIQATDNTKKIQSAVGGKNGDIVKTTASGTASDMEGADQGTPDGQKEGKVFAGKDEKKIKAPDSKEKKTKEPKDGKKPDSSMSKMAAGKSGETQGAAPLAKNYNVTRVGDTLQYTRLGEPKPKGQTANPITPPHATQTPNQVATKPASTGPDQPRGTAQSPQQAPVPVQSGKTTTSAPNAKQPEGQRWKALFAERQKARQSESARKAGAKVMGRKGQLFVKSEEDPSKKSTLDSVASEKASKTQGNALIKSEPEEFENTPGNRRRARDEAEQDRKNYGKDLYEKENPPEQQPPQPLKKDVVQFKKPAAKKKDKEPAKPGAQGMFDVLNRGKSQLRPGNSEQKIKAALAAQADTNPYAEQRLSPNQLLGERGNQGGPKNPKYEAAKERQKTGEKAPAKTPTQGVESRAAAAGKSWAQKNPTLDTRFGPATKPAEQAEAQSRNERIRNSLNKINNLMASLKQFSQNEAAKENPHNRKTQLKQVTGGGANTPANKIQPANGNKVHDKVAANPAAPSTPEMTPSTQSKKMSTTHEKINRKNPDPSKPILVRDMHRMKAHTATGRPFRVMLANHPSHAELPGYHLGLDKPHSTNQISRHLSNPISPISKAVHAAIERGHDKLIVHNPDQPFKTGKE